MPAYIHANLSPAAVFCLVPGALAVYTPDALVFKTYEARTCCTARPKCLDLTQHVCLALGGCRYMGQNGQCRSDKVTKAAHFKGYQLVAEKDEKAMMEAVATHGPIAISFDAVHPTFK
jgi:hypothetical protein